MRSGTLEIFRTGEVGTPRIRYRARAAGQVHHLGVAGPSGAGPWTG